MLDKMDRQVQTAVSCTDGLLSFFKVPVGSYEIRELEAPEGFTISGKAVQIEITETH